MARETRLSMTPAAARAFLAGKSVVILATNDTEGVPVGDVARYAIVDGALCFSLPAGGPTHANLQRDARIACCAEQNPSYLEIAAVVVHGRAEPVTDPAAITKLAAAIENRGAPIPTDSPARHGGAVIFYRVPIGDDVMSFDFAKIEDKSKVVDH